MLCSKCGFLYPDTLFACPNCGASEPDHPNDLYTAAPKKGSSPSIQEGKLDASQKYVYQKLGPAAYGPIQTRTEQDQSSAQIRKPYGFAYSKAMASSDAINQAGRIPTPEDEEKYRQILQASSHGDIPFQESCENMNGTTYTKGNPSENLQELEPNKQDIPQKGAWQWPLGEPIKSEEPKPYHKEKVTEKDSEEDENIDDETMKKNGFAIASIIFGLLSFVIFPVITSVLAIIFSNVSNRKIGKTTMAKVGKVLGIVSIIAWAALIAFWIWRFGLTIPAYLSNSLYSN